MILGAFVKILHKFVYESILRTRRVFYFAHVTFTHLSLCPRQIADVRIQFIFLCINRLYFIVSLFRFQMIKRLNQISEGIVYHYAE